MMPGSGDGNAGGGTGGGGGTDTHAESEDAARQTEYASIEAEIEVISNYSEYVAALESISDYHNDYQDANNIHSERSQLDYKIRTTIAGIYPDLSSRDGSEDFERFFAGDEEELIFRGDSHMFESNIKREQSRTTLNANGIGVKGILALPESLTREGIDDPDFPLLRFHYTRDRKDRYVTYRFNDYNRADQEYHIPPGTEARQHYSSDLEEDSPYDIDQYGWWSRLTPYVGVLGLYASDSSSTQNHYVITGPGTLVEDMPTGTATFTGSFYSQSYRQNSGSSSHRQRIAGDVTLNVAFDDGTLNGNITNVKGMAPGLPWVPVREFDSWGTSSFSITNGAITGNEFTATLTGRDRSQSSQDVASVRGFTGSIEGGFFGPPTEDQMIGAAVTATRDLAGTDNDRNLYGYIVAD